ncbi:hypothetical protein [Peribacillus kribbensis]|uniref:hypothetical protein n=1 Tax=Peribacillus kribbensis TaxID=356658 RepID=UPI00040B539B|nr:hypothetical protein [Peribacillus kribbensis]
MIKKSLAALFVMLFAFSFGTMAFASENSDVEKGLQIIDEANKQIDSLIAETVAKGDELKAAHDENTAALTADTVLTENQKAEKIAAENTSYNAALDELISTLQDKAIELTNAGIEKAAVYGIEAVCQWKLVKIADREVWVDPIQVIGF